MGRYALGVDVGGTKALCILCDVNGNVIARDKFSSHADDDDPLDTVITGTLRFLANSGVPKEEIVGTGMGLPGIIQPATNQLVNAPGFVSRHQDIQEYVSARLPAPIILDNDVNMAVLGEWWLGSARERENVVLISIGTGIGAGLLVNGQVYRGARGFAGEVGQLQVDPHTKRTTPASLDEFGPFESLASGHGIRNAAQQHYHEFPHTRLNQGDLSAEKVFEAAMTGDPLGTFVIDRVFDYIAFSIANIIATLDPDIVLIGGGVSRQGAGFVEEVKRRVAHLTPYPFALDLAVLGEDAGAYGAAASAFKSAGLIG